MVASIGEDMIPYRIVHRRFLYVTREFTIGEDKVNYLGHGT